MTLEEALKQKTFGNEIEKGIVNVIFTANHFHSLNQKRFKTHGISPEQYNVLRILRGSNPKKLSVLDISSRMLDRNSNATRLVEKLRLKHLLERNVCPNDRRQVEIGITTEGLALLQKLDIEMNKWLEKYNGISKEEASQLNLLLDKMRI
jgi:DNA-binding MarR family transcriptional regulator